MCADGLLRCFVYDTIAGCEAAAAAYAVDDESAIAAAIGASLDLQEASAGNGGGSRNHVGGTSGAIPSPGPSEFTGTNEAQDLAFLTDAPLLPPAYAPASWGRGGGSGGLSGGGGGGVSVVEAARRGQGILGRSGEDMEQGQAGGARGRGRGAGRWSGAGTAVFGENGATGWAFIVACIP